MTNGTLSRTEIERLLDELAERLHEKRTFAKLHVVGGACLALAYERDRTTEDIDVRVDTGHEALEEAIREIKADVKSFDARLRAVEGDTREIRTQLQHVATRAWVLGGILAGMGVAAGIGVGLARLFFS